MLPPERNNRASTSRLAPNDIFPFTPALPRKVVYTATTVTNTKYDLVIFRYTISGDNELLPRQADEIPPKLQSPGIHHGIILGCLKRTAASLNNPSKLLYLISLPEIIVDGLCCQLLPPVKTGLLGEFSNKAIHIRINAIFSKIRFQGSAGVDEIDVSGM